MKLHNHLGVGVQLKMYIYNGHSTTVQTPPGLAYDNSLHFFAGT